MLKFKTNAFNMTELKGPKYMVQRYPDLVHPEDDSWVHGQDKERAKSLPNSKQAQ